LVEWERAGVWRRLHETLLAELRRRGRLDQRRTVVDSGSVRAMRGGKKLDRTQPIARGDRGYDSQPHRDRLAARGIIAIFGRRRTSHGSGLGVFRWVVERTLAWLHRFRRLAVRYERHDRVHHAFLTLGCALICWNYLKSTGRVF
jgi:transposase